MKCLSRILFLACFFASLGSAQNSSVFSYADYMEIAKNTKNMIHLPDSSTLVEELININDQGLLIPIYDIYERQETAENSYLF